MIKKNTGQKKINTSKGLIKKLASKASFYFDRVKCKFIEIFSKNEDKQVDRKFSRRIYEVVHKNDINKQKNRYEGKKTLNRRLHNELQVSSKKQVVIWSKKTIFKTKRLNITRFELLVTICVAILIITSAVMIGTTNINGNNNDAVMNVAGLDEEKDNIKTVYITYGEHSIKVETTASTVGEVLDENDITYDNVTLSHSINEMIADNISIEVNQPFEVKIYWLDKEYEINFSSGTVADALQEAGIEYDEDDIVEPDLLTSLKTGMEITYSKVEVIEIIEEVELDFELEERDEPGIEVGYYDILQEGEKGLQVNIIKITYINDIEDSREIVSEEVIKEPINKIKRNGTCPIKTDDPHDSNNDDYDEIVVTNPGEQATNPDIPDAPSSYIEKITAHVTAYTHTGRTTATGTWPRSTRTLANPGSCAVVPDTFPYGSLLYVPGYGYCIAEDTGGFRHDPDRWNQIDLFMNTEKECIIWGRKREWTIYVLRYGS